MARMLALLLGLCIGIGGFTGVAGAQNQTNAARSGQGARVGGASGQSAHQDRVVSPPMEAEAPILQRSNLPELTGMHDFILQGVTSGDSSSGGNPSVANFDSAPQTPQQQVRPERDTPRISGGESPEGGVGDGDENEEDEDAPDEDKWSWWTWVGIIFGVVIVIAIFLNR